MPDFCSAARMSPSRLGSRELPGRKIDRNPDWRQPLTLPCHVLRAGRLQDPFADRHDQARFLGQLNEATGQQQAKIGMVPAQQGLDA